jgi:cell division protein FtsW (lipid II flippase)
MLVIVLKTCVVALFLLMVVRAFQSGSTLDRVLGGYLLVGLVLLFTLPALIASSWLTLGACAYLASQVLTSARVVSRALPLLGGVLVWMLYFAKAAGV